MKKSIIILLLILIPFILLPNIDKKEEKKDKFSSRGFIIAKNNNGALLSWKALTEDNDKTTFKLYKNNKLLKIFDNNEPTNYFDTNYIEKDNFILKIYDDKKVVDIIEPEIVFQKMKNGNNGSYFDISLNLPKPVFMPNGEVATYTPNDIVAYDVDNDGMYEFIVKWDPTNSKDNSIRGYTGNVYIDCYKLNGKRLWRIDLGKNIRAGAAYTQMLVYDYDKDKKAEVILKTADGTIDNFGNIIGNNLIDNRNNEGFIIQGNEYLSLFDGTTGKILNTINYYPKRGEINDWGDKTGNRADRFLASTAYLDGNNPSAILIRGIYTRIVAVSYKVVNKKLIQEWIFDTNEQLNKDYEGNANHQVFPSDVDNDKKDEIVLGSLVIDNDGTILHNTNLGHGDSLHIGDFDKENEGIEIFMCHEIKDYGISLRDGKTGKILFRNTGRSDTGRCMIDNIIKNNSTSEMVGSHDLILYDNKGKIISNWNTSNNDWSKKEGYGINFLVYWDGDIERELLNDIQIKKYGEKPLFIGENIKSNNSTKQNPSLSADLFGDYREEVIFPTKDNKKIRIYTTTIYSENKVISLMENRQYKLQAILQNIGYNQPPHLDYYLDNKTN